MASDCFFCKLVNGEVNALKVFESDHFIGVLDINPASNGHILLVLKRHVATFDELNEIEVVELFDALDFIVRKIKDVLNAKGFQIFIANGPESGQRVEHFLVHIIPTYGEDAIPYQYNKFDAEKINKAASELKQLLKK